nr:ABC transporter ATP-binding protein [Bauldia sp.]
RVRPDGYGSSPRGESGRPVELALSPEQSHLAPGLPDMVSLPLTLALIEPMGADSLLWGTVGADPVSVRAHPDEVHRIGETVTAHFQPSRASLFDAGTGDRI